MAITTNSYKEYLDSSRAVIILFMVNAVLQCVFHLIKFIRYRSSAVPAPLQKAEQVLDMAFALGIIAILNIISLSLYIFACIMSYLFLLTFIFFNAVPLKLPDNKKGIFQMLIPGVFTFLLFMNYFIDDHSSW